MAFDFLIKGGTVIDPAQGLFAQRDVALAGSQVAAVESSISEASAKQSIDARGCLVTPGLIDLHTHVNYGNDRLGVEPDSIAARTGVTTLVDAGSTGANNFLGFRRYVIEPAHSRIVPLLNISVIGLVGCMDIGEAADIRLCNLERTVQVAQAHRDLIAGIKIRSAGDVVGQNGLAPLELARAAAERLGLPLMVHIGIGLPYFSPPVEEILARTRPGDILTHCFTGHAQTILDKHGAIKPAVLEARQRGVIMDIGHGMGSFTFATAKEALAQGFKPDVISTDLHQFNINGPVFDLPTTLSKLLALGMELEEVIAAATVAPARALGTAGAGLGTLQVGSPGDVAVYRLVEGRFELRDVFGGTLPAERRLEHVLTVRAGQVMRRC